ncbi:translation initiation factor IF-2, mitochondrial [Leptopilina boulardi]|uniref:translation initiation factor IF-2, mitochondrial n=1 Tax=Leptopilina boulardi TaxID=63433 RepID=UPI0021F5703B|nr:translation initiation factor IF-2, mitochondrial [Leptopilina boulardi]
MLNVAGNLVKIGTKRWNMFDRECRIQSIIQRIRILTISCLQCQYYHTTSIYFKHQKASELKKTKRVNIQMIATPKKQFNKVQVWKGITVNELAINCNRNEEQIFEVLSLIGVKGNFESNTSIVSVSVIKDVVEKMGFRIQMKSKYEKKEDSKLEKEMELTKRPPIDPLVLITRHPVVTIMGHVDHGKTTLLDSLRNTSVVETEFGGITQHIGAFNVTLNSGDKITFLDTPGHAAFKIMRERGANVTDIVVLVVAADDGVMEQTLQSITMIKNANVPLIVAINKIDKPSADIERTKRMLTQHGILVEDLGGDVQSVNISALMKTNLDALKDAIITQADLLNLKGDPKGPVEGVIIESTTHPGKGKVATSLIQRGTLKRGTIIVSGLTMGKVRAMYDHEGNQLKTVSLSDAVQITGWKDLPMAGDVMFAVENEHKAHEIIRIREAIKMDNLAVEHRQESDKRLEEHLIGYREDLKKRREFGSPKKRTQKLFLSTKKIEDDHVKLNIIIKGDVVGSVEAILDVLVTYRNHDKCALSIIQHEVGPVTESDIEMAKIFNAIIYCFNTDIPKNLTELIKNGKVQVKTHNVIYKLVDDLKDEISKKLPLIEIEDSIGEAIVLKEFEINDKKKTVKVAGCRCTQGTLKKSSLYKVVRDDDVISRCKIVSMRHLKSEVDSIKKDMECGLLFDDSTITFQPNDLIVSYKIRHELQHTNWNPGF